MSIRDSICAFALAITAAAPLAAQSAGPVLALGLNESAGNSAYDASSSANHGALSGATRITSGKYGPAVSFNGSTSVLMVPNSPSLNLNGSGITVEFWAYRKDTANTDQVVLSKGGSGQFYSYGFEFQNSSNASMPVFFVQFADGTLQSLPFAMRYRVNTWQHYAATYDGTTLRAYFNGALTAARTVSGTLKADGRPLYLGADKFLQQHLNGALDEIRIYDRALSPAEVAADMNTPIALPTDTTPPTVAIALPAAEASVNGTIPLTVNAGDNVGIAGVQYVVDGATFGSEVLLKPFTATLDTTQLAAGLHTVAAIARDFANNKTTSAYVNISVTAPVASQIGQWSAPFNWPIVTVHAALLPTGEVLAIDGQDQGNMASVWNPTTNTFTSNPNNFSNIFCSGHAQLADGRQLVSGGHVAANVGIRDANLFDPATHKWTLATKMAYARWYPTVTTLPDGRAISMSGTTTCSTCIADIPEVYDPIANTWTQLTAARLPIPMYPFNYVLPDGRLLVAGANEESIPTRILDVNTQTWTMVDPVTADGASGAMYLPGKVVKAGSSTDPDDPGMLSERNTFVLDANAPAPKWRETMPMWFPRIYQNFTILPDGSVLSTGGSRSSDVFDLGSAVYETELWSPVTETWTILAKSRTPRLYHSIALLLPDGRVLSSGGGRYGVDQFSGEIFSPPYLFKGPRPVISAAPSVLSYGGAFTVATPDAVRIQTVSLIRYGSVTHGVNMDQRYLPLTFQSDGTSLTVQVPANANLAPPGYYMLFLVDNTGVPSIAATVRLPGPGEDSQLPTAPGNLTGMGGIGYSALTWTASTDNVAVAGYDVYRSTAAGVAAVLANRVAQTSATSFTEALPAGTYYYIVTARDARGNVSTASNEVGVSVLADTVPPGVSIVTPVANTTVAGSTAVSASVSDNVGVVGVQFLLDGAAIGSELATSPFSITWDTTAVTNGAHTLAARARDAAGNATTSAAITVQVSNTAAVGPALAYGFNGSGTTVADSSGNANTGTLTSAAWLATGKYGRALSFSGTGYVTTANSASINISGKGFTIEFWAYRKDTASGDQAVISKDGTAQFYHYGFEFQNSASTRMPVFFLQLTDGTLQSLPVGAQFVANQWQHYALTYDGASMKVYVGGALTASKSIAGAIKAEGNPLHIGADRTLGQKLNGAIDELRIYNRALMQAEIQSDMNKALP